MSKIYFLPAKHGDAFIIECNRGEAQGLIVVDGGPTGCGYVLHNKLKELGTPDLIVLTHYDDDHIGGILQLLSTCLDDGIIPAKEVWANCAEYIEVAEDKTLSTKQGAKLSAKLNKLRDRYGLIWRNDLSEGCQYDYPFASIEVVSPTKAFMDMAIKKQEEESDEQLLKAKHNNVDDLAIPLDKLAEHKPDEPNIEKDNELANAASIALILRCDGLSILMLGDSYPQNVESYLRNVKGYSEENPLVVDYVKVSHHGSRNNISNELLDIIKCNKYIISTNGGKNKANHPNRTAIAHILCHPQRDKGETVLFYLNYALDVIEANGTPFFKEEEKQEWNFKVYEKTVDL